MGNLKLRAIIFLVVFLLLIDLAIPGILKYLDTKSKYTHYFEENFRFGENVDNIVLDAYIYHIKNTDGLKVAFIGDSVIAGAMVKNNSQTIPAYFRDQIKTLSQRDIRVYNIGMPGNRPADIYFTFKKICENNAADIVITNINYAFYSDKMLGEKSVARPELYYDVMDQGSIQKLKLSNSIVENFLENKIINKWKLYRDREEISFYLFGRNPRQALVQGVNMGKGLEVNPVLVSPVNLQNSLDKPWNENTPFPQEKLDHWVEVFASRKIDTSNQGYYFLQKMLEEAKSNNIKLISFLTPVNTAMITKYDLLKKGQDFYENLDTIKLEYSKAGLSIFDYTKSIKDNNFADLFHLIGSGNSEVAEHLAADTKDTILRELEK